MEFDELTRTLGERLGLGELTVDETGAVALTFDDMPVALRHEADKGRVLLAGEVGQPPERGAEAFESMMLTANGLFDGTGGATLGKDPDGQCYALCRSERLEGLTFEAFWDVLGGFVGLLGEWRERLEDFRRIGPAVESRRAERDAAEVKGPEDGMIKV